MQYSKTEAGQQAFKQRSALMSARQRSVFILCDGQKTAEQIVAATASLGVTPADVEHLVAQGFLVTVPESHVASEPVLTDVVAVAPVLADEPSKRTLQERYSDAKPIATRLTAALGLRGFRLNLAVEAAAGFEDLLMLYPKIEEAVGRAAAQELERALKG